MTFAQGQIILNAYYAIEFYPFLRTTKPTSTLTPAERDAMLQRIRVAKEELYDRGYRQPTINNYELAFSLTAAEVRDIMLILAGILAEGREDPLNIEPVMGARLGKIEDLISTLRKFRDSLPIGMS